jgi:hypothetical protein
MIRTILALLCGLVGTTAFATEEVLTIQTRSGVTLSYLLVQDKPAVPEIVVISFVGGYGGIDLVTLSQNNKPRFSPMANFLVRIRDLVADADTVDVIVDAPSDKLPQGMTDGFRQGADHLADARALIADLKMRFPRAKVYLLGTSRGTISAATLAAELGNSVQGVILTSTTTKRDRMGEALSRFDFTTIKIPVLLVHHRDDGCVTSPYWEASRLSRNFPLVSVSGGDPPQSDPCEPLSPHGFFGREAPVVNAMKNWMLGRDFTRDIR